MSVDRIIGERFAAWQNELFNWGFDLADPSPHRIRQGTLVSEARYPATIGPPGIEVSVQELWRPGDEPAAIEGTTERAGYLVSASWHAQFTGVAGMSMDEASYRLDLDRRKPHELWVHVHPFGRESRARQGRSRLPSPSEWLDDVLAIRTDLT